MRLLVSSSILVAAVLTAGTAVAQTVDCNDPSSILSSHVNYDACMDLCTPDDCGGLPDCCNEFCWSRFPVDSDILRLCQAADNEHRLWCTTTGIVDPSTIPNCWLPGGSCCCAAGYGCTLASGGGGGSSTPTYPTGGGGWSCVPCNCYGEYTSYEGYACGRDVSEMTSSCWSSCW